MNIETYDRETVELVVRDLMNTGIRFMFFETRNSSRESKFLNDIVEAGLRYKFPDSGWKVNVIVLGDDIEVTYSCTVSELPHAPIENLYIEFKVGTQNVTI